MYKEKKIENEQVNISSPYIGMSPKRQKRLKDSWAGDFYEEIYCKIDEKPFSVLFSEKGSRPNTPVRLLLAALVLKEMRAYTDEELLEAIDFDLQVRAALGLDCAGEDELPFSGRTLTRFRTKLFDYEQETGVDLVHGAIKDLLDNFNQKMKTDQSLRRMDSFQVASNIKNLTRLGILYETTKVGIKAMNKAEIEIPESLLHYLEPYDSNHIFYYDKTTTYEEKAERLIEEILKTLDLLKSQDDFKDEQALLQRVVDEQLIEEDGKMRFKKNKSEGLNSQTLQSPYDPDATFREKNGAHIGYVGNVEECATEDGQSMIVDYQYEQNTYSDSQFMKDFIEREETTLENPLMIVTDGAYASVENSRLAEQNGIEHVPTQLTGRKTEDICADFTFNETGTEILECPNKVKPLRCSYNQQNGQCRAVFEKSECENCPFKEKCHPIEQKKTKVKNLSIKSSLRAKTRRRQKGDKFIECQNFRNGSEAVPAVLRQKYKLDRMPVRGIIRTRHCFGFKIAGLAATKFLRFKKCQNRPSEKCA